MNCSRPLRIHGNAVRAVMVLCMCSPLLSGCGDSRQSGQSAAPDLTEVPTPIGDNAAASPTAAQVQKLRDRAETLRRRRDGQGCLTALERADSLARSSTAVADPAADHVSMGWTRAACQILAGQCDEGGRAMMHYYTANAGMPREQAEARGREAVLLMCPTHIGPWSERLHRIDFQSGEAWKRKAVLWCKTQLADLDEAEAEAGRNLDQQSRGRARRSRRLLRQCVAAAADNAGGR